MNGLRSRDTANLAVMASLWIAAAILVNPLGEFAVNDDWAYRETVVQLVEHGTFYLSGWAAANLVSHLAWGSAFAAIFGTSFTALRISSLVAGLVAGIALYRLVRLAGQTPGVALLAALTLLFNPLFFSLAFSFMSDVSYTAMQTVALWLFAAGTLKPSAIMRAGGWIAGAAALLSRQTGLAVPLGIGAERVLRARFGLRSIVRAAIPVVLFVALQFAFQAWLRASGQMPQLYGSQVARVGDTMLHHPVLLIGKMSQMVVYQFFYLGLFALPLTVALVPEGVRDWSVAQRRMAAVAAVAASLVVAAGVSRVWRPFPMWANTLMANVYGPDLEMARAPAWLSLAVTAVAAGGGLLLCLALWTLARRLRADAGRRVFSVTWLVLLTGLAYDAAVALVINGFDRYLIPLLPCVLLVLAMAAPKLALRGPAMRAAAVAGVVLAAVSICGTHDFLAAKRVQLAAYQVVARTVPATRINAGWVVKGSAGYARYGTRDICCWYDQEDYIVLTGEAPKPGFRVIGRYPVSRWLPWEWGRYPVLVQQRVAR